MAVVIKVDGFDLLMSLGVPPDTVGQLSTLGISLYIQPNFVKFVKDADVISAFPIKGVSAHKFIKGEMPEEDVVGMMTLATDACIKAINTVGGDHDIYTISKPAPGEVTIKGPKVVKPWAQVVKSKDAAHIKTMLEEDQVPIDDPVDTPPKVISDAPPAGKFVFDVSKMSTASRVPLSKATKLYQPVNGSGDSSRYFCVASRDDLKVAARFRDGQMSIRVEGDIAKYKSALVASGLDGNIEMGSYASVHLSVDNTMLARKTLGAAILGLSTNFDTPMPDAAILEEKGA